MNIDLLNDRYKYSSVTNFIEMSEESIKAKDEFLQKYDERDCLTDQQCYICDNTDFICISQVDRYGFYYPTGICNVCGNVQQIQYHTQDILVDFYTNYYRKIYGNPSPEDLYKSQKSEKGKAIYDFVSKIHKPNKVLEIGCGSGGILSVFRDNGCEVTGLDFDEDYLAIATKNDINTVIGSVDSLRPDDKYDCIIMSHVLEHIVDPKQFITNLKKHLVEDGILYVEVPSLDNVYNGGYQHDLLRYFQNAHTIHFSEKSLTLLAKTIGFDVIKSTSFIHSCWKQNPAIDVVTSDDMANCLSSTKQMLSEIETRRTGYWKYVSKTKTGLKKFVVAILTAVGLKDIVKKMYLAITKR